MRIDLLGAEFNIKTDQDPEYLNEVVRLYRDKIDEIRKSVGTQDPLKIAILAGILTADDYLKLTGTQRTGSDEVNRIAGDLIRALDSALEQDDGPPADTPLI